MASPTDGNHRNVMVGFCPRADDEVISSMTAADG
jgi:hypothetical protein